MNVEHLNLSEAQKQCLKLARALDDADAKLIALERDKARLDYYEQHGPEHIIPAYDLRNEGWIWIVQNTVHRGLRAAIAAAMEANK